MATDYRSIIKEYLTEFASKRNAQLSNTYQLLFDTQHDQYQVLRMGWEGSRRVYNVPIHISIQNNQVWIQQNNTDQEIAAQLIERGILAQQIVLGFQPPTMRYLTGFATGET
jgi:hypothetical protein